MRRPSVNLNADTKLWIYVVCALVVGLLIPDSMNPVKMIMDKIQGDKAKKDLKGKLDKETT